MNLEKISQKLRIKWNFELTVFELTFPDLYLIVRTGTFKYFQQDRKNWKIPQKNFENLFESIIFKRTWIEFQKQ